VVAGKAYLLTEIAYAVVLWAECPIYGINPKTIAKRESAQAWKTDQ